MDTPKLIPINVAAIKYGLPRKWLASEAKAGRLPSLIADGAILFDESVLTSELARRASQHPASPVTAPRLTIIGGSR